MIDVSADDDHRAHLGHRAAEPREADRQKGIARVPEQRLHRLHACQAERAELLGIFRVQVLEHLGGAGPVAFARFSRLDRDRRRSVIEAWRSMLILTTPVVFWPV